MYLHIYQPNVTPPWSSWAPRSGWIVAFENPRFHLLRELQDWCRATYGEPSDTRWHDQLRWGEVWFRDEADAMLFQLRWS